MLHELCNWNGALWDVIVNDVRRDERFQQPPENVRMLYNNAAERPVVRRRVREFIGREQRQGLLERANEMRYANRMDPLQREAARGAIQQYIAPINVNGEDNVQQHENVQGNIPPRNDGDAFIAAHNPALAPQPQEQREEDVRLLPGEDDGKDGEDGLPPQPVNHEIPVPNGRPGRRPYHEIARENAEALNVLLTREIPQLTNQLQYTMEQMNQLIQRQLDN